ncbi:MAG: hypothetical protein V2J51_16330 [Erythrobacter sp.]|jgi:hypothetical protein|nr:hypothetical protein [Erythrobacter sp.]
MRGPAHRERPFTQRVAIVLAVVLQIGATFLPQLGFGEPIGERSDAVRTLITPIGWTFAIWGPLFLGSAAFAVWQAMPGQRRSALLDRIAWPAAIALAAQGVWAIYTQFAALTFVSALIILTSLVGLLICFRALSKAATLSAGERWIAALPLSALAAWLTAASIVNISATLVYHGVAEGGFSQPEIAAGMIAVGGIIAGLASYRSRGNPWYALAFIWALFGIYSRGGEAEMLVAAATIGAGIFVAASCLSALAKPDNRRHWIGI